MKGGQNDEEAYSLYPNIYPGNFHPIPWTLTAFAGDFHVAPFDFIFDNHIDTHQQTLLRVKRGNPVSLFGFFYIIFTGVTVPESCDKINAGDLENLDPTAVDRTCPGWFLQIRAVRRFAFEHGGETIPVRPGIDNATHLNLVTNNAAVSEITEIGSTR